MIVPGTRFAIARVPLERIVITECEPRYLARVQHYVKLLSDPAHMTHDPGLIHLTPFGPPDSGQYTILDGHHRFIASVMTGRSYMLALVLIEPGQPGYDALPAAPDTTHSLVLLASA